MHLALETSGDGISIEYVSNTEARIHWKPLTEERLQHYEVCRSFVLYSNFMNVKQNIGYFGRIGEK